MEMLERELRTKAIPPISSPSPYPPSSPNKPHDPRGRNLEPDINARARS